jgi:AraC-like DNA-binding protein
MLDPDQPATRVAGARGPGAAGGDATSRIASLVVLPQVLRELGFEPSAVLDGTGFDPSYFTDPDLPIQYRAGTRLLKHCAAVTGCEHLGLLIGERVDSTILGLPGLLLMSAKDVGTGLRDLAQYMELHDRGAVVTLEEDRHTALLCYSVVATVAGVDHLNDMAMTLAGNLMRGFCGKDWKPNEVLLTRRPPTDPQIWERFFRAPVRFGAERCGMRFPAHWLAVSVPAANPVLHKLLQQEAERLHSLRGTGLAHEVKRMVRATASNPPCSAARVASLLGMHERTLNRRLQATGVNFRRLRDEVLYEMSQQILSTSSMRLTEVAAALGYAEDSAFIHAFTRWSGQTPDQWRRKMDRPGPLDRA